MLFLRHRAQASVVAAVAAAEVLGPVARDTGAVERLHLSLRSCTCASISADNAREISTDTHLARVACCALLYGGEVSDEQRSSNLFSSLLTGLRFCPTLELPAAMPLVFVVARSRSRRHLGLSATHGGVHCRSWRAFYSDIDS